MNGIIVLDKPSGWTSHDVVAKLRGALRIKRIGHGGTLDPMATGVLPVFIGRATRASEFCENAQKEYYAGLRLGIVTDTQDATGSIIGGREPVVSNLPEEMRAPDGLSAGDACTGLLTAGHLLKVIPRFLYEQKQLPPMYSAVKIGGRKLYELARRGEVVERKKRDIYISEIELLEGYDETDGMRGRLTAADAGAAGVTGNKDSGDETAVPVCGDSCFMLRIVCSKGTYIRTLCHDIGEALGCGGVMSYLRRSRAGFLSLGMAHTLSEVLEAASSGDLDRLILPVDMLFSDYEAVTLDERSVNKCMNGAVYGADALLIAGARYRVYAPDGEFLALGEAGAGVIKTVKSFYSI